MIDMPSIFSININLPRRNLLEWASKIMKFNWTIEIKLFHKVGFFLNPSQAFIYNN